MSQSAASKGELVTTNELQCELWRQEHRFFHIIRNFLTSRTLNVDDPLRAASQEAVAYRIAVSLVPQVATAGVGLVAILGLIIASQANGLLSEQNKTIAAQSLLLDKQTRLLERQIKYEELPFLAFEGSTQVPLIRRSPAGEWEVVEGKLNQFQSKESQRFSWPVIRNFGGGPAFDVQMTWQVEGTQTTPSAYVENRQLFSGAQAQVHTLPFIPIGEHACNGIVKLEYRDCEGKWRVTEQRFHAHRSDQENSALLAIEIDELLTQPFGQTIDGVEHSKTGWGRWTTGN